MTIKQFCKSVREANPGITITWQSEVGEFRINLTNGSEATAYYTDDRDDAAATAKAMWDYRYKKVTK